jgi:hypothetical protein
LSYFSNFWFPWLVIVGGQLPVALAWAVAAPKFRREAEAAAKTVVIPVPQRAPAHATATPSLARELPDAPGYTFLSDSPFGEGAFGKVWLVRNVVGQMQALKAVYQAKFGANTRPYEAEFKAITKYKPVSNNHPGLLHVELC